MSNTAKTLGRKRMSVIAAGIATMAMALTACATDSPTNPGTTEPETPSALTSVNIIVPADPGGGWDGLGRTMQSVLTDSKILSSAPVENIGGAGGTIGLASINNKPANTLFVTGLVMVGAVETNKSKVRIEDTTPIARLTEEALVIVVPADSKYKTLKDLVDDVIANGHAVSITGGSAGGADHILAAMLLREAGVAAEDVDSKLNYVANSGGGEAVTLLLGNNVSAGISGVSEFSEHVLSGSLRALAVSSPARNGILKDAPTIMEGGYDLELTNWRGVLAPGGISDEERQQLLDVVDKMYNTPAWKDALKTKGWDDAYMAGDEFAKYIQGNITEIKATLKAVGLIQ
ncbi:MAG: tripartite tricarboxylate transporter substrate-binding protein [Microbacteriaceae bacterium]